MFEFKADEICDCKMHYDEFERLMIESGMDADMVINLVEFMGMAEMEYLNMAEIMKRMGGMVFTGPIQIVDRLIIPRASVN